MKKLLLVLSLLWVSLAQAQDVINPQNNATNLTTGTLASARMGPINSVLVNSSYDISTASGNQTVSGFGFTPSSCVGYGAVSAAVTSYTVFNASVDSALTQSNVKVGGGAFAFRNTDFFAVQDTAGTSFAIGTVTAFNSGSITIAWVKTGTPTGTFSFSIRCFK